MIQSITNHLLQSTIFAAVAGVLTLFLRNNHARTRYWIWLAASMKFLIPFSLFVELGHRLSWSGKPAITQPALAIVMDEIGQPFATVDVSGPMATAPSIWPLVMLVAWICGCVAVLIFWLVRWRRVAATLRTGVPIREGRELLALRRFDANIELISSPSELEPGVFGIVRPVLSLPAGISDHLSDEQLDAVIAHELCHIRRRDNLTATLHMLVEAVFWFHPLVWWLGARLVEERERACDEEVVRLGSDPEVYAESILRICRFYLASPLDCAAGISGADLRKRIEEIMTHPILNSLSFGKKLMLGTLGVVALMTPITIGVFTAPVVHAQRQTPVPAASPVAQAAPEPTRKPAPSAARLEFETASIKPLNMTVAEAFQAGHLDWHIDDAMADLQGATLISLMQFAWHVPQNQITNAQGWMNSVTFDVRGKLPAGSTKGQVPAMLQSLLADRFKLAVHHQSEIRPAYELTVGNKLNLTPSVAPDPLEKNKCKDDTGQRVCRNMTMPELANLLSGLANMQALRGAVGDVPDWTIDRPVVDMTNLSGAFDFPLDYGRNASSRGNGQVVNIRDSINSLGLKLVPAKLPFDVIFIDHADRVPTGN